MLGLIGEAISLRSFSSLWYWAAVAAFWFWVNGRVLGLPFSLLRRAQDGDLLNQMAHFAAEAWVQSWRRAQVLWVAGYAAVLVGLSMLAFSYGIELAQALWFFIAPKALLSALQLRLAARILGQNAVGDDLLRLMYRFRLSLQIIGFMFIFLNVSFAFLHLLIHGYFR